MGPKPTGKIPIKIPMGDKIPVKIPDDKIPKPKERWGCPIPTQACVLGNPQMGWYQAALAGTGNTGLYNSQEECEAVEPCSIDFISEILN